MVTSRESLGQCLIGITSRWLKNYIRKVGSKKCNTMQNIRISLVSTNKATFDSIFALLFQVRKLTWLLPLKTVSKFINVYIYCTCLFACFYFLCIILLMQPNGRFERPSISYILSIHVSLTLLQNLEDFCFHFIVCHLTAVTQTVSFKALDGETVKNLIIKASEAGAFKR